MTSKAWLMVKDESEVIGSGIWQKFVMKGILAQRLYL